MNKEVKNDPIESTANLNTFSDAYPVEMPFFESIKIQMDTWILRNKIVDANTLERDSLKLDSLYKFAPRLFPNANPRIQILASKLFFLLFLMDDNADSHHGNYWSDLWEYHLCYDKEKSNNPDLIKIAIEIIDLLNLCETTGRRPQLLKGFIEFIHAGVNEKSKWRDSNFPSLNEYLDFNRKSSGVGLSFEILEIAHPELGYLIPSDFFDEMKRLIGDLIILTNDLDSYKKEHLENDINNLVILNKLKKKYSWETSENQVETIVGQKFQTLEVLFTRFINTMGSAEAMLSGKMDTSCKFYNCFEKLIHIFLGCKYWAKYDSKRYQ